MLISRTQGTRPGRNTGRAAGVQDSERRLAYQPVSRITYGCMSEQDTALEHKRRHLISVLSSQILSIPRFTPAHRLGHGSSFTNQPNNPTSTPSLSRLNPRQAPQNRRVDPDPTTGHPQVSLSGALLCGCGASKHTDQPQTSLEGTFPTSTACVVGRQHQPTRQLHVDAERPPPSPTIRPKENAHWIGPLVTRSTQGCRRRLLPFGFSDLRKQDSGSPALCSARFETC